MFKFTSTVLSLLASGTISQAAASQGFTSLTCTEGNVSLTFQASDNPHLTKLYATDSRTSFSYNEGAVVVMPDDEIFAATLLEGDEIAYLVGIPGTFKRLWKNSYHLVAIYQGRFENQGPVQQISVHCHLSAKGAL